MQFLGERSFAHCVGSAGRDNAVGHPIAGPNMSVGELFILGFFGKIVPPWLKAFADRFGLGGVILFDYSCQTRQYDNNIDSAEQVRRLCDEIACLPSRPMVFVD